MPQSGAARRLCATWATLALVCFLSTCSSSDATGSSPSSTTGPPSTDNATESEISSIPIDLSFQVPFQVAKVQGLDMKFSAQYHDLRIKSMLEQSQSGKAQQTCTTGSNDPHTIDKVPALHVTDRLVRADGVEVSLKSFEQITDAPIGSVMLLPLFKPVSDQQDATTNVLSGFARIEIFHPKTLDFEPTTAEREDEIQKWKAAVAKQQQEALEKQLAAANDKAAREQEEKDRRAADENARLEREAREKLELEEMERLSMTPHSRVGEKRGKGIEFRYEVEFTRDGPIGINWDLHTTNKTVVSYLEPTLRAHALGIIASRGQLIQLNDVNTAEMGPHEVVAAYVMTSLPRTLVFLCASTKPRTVAVDANTSLVNVIQNWTLAFVQPQVLSEWHVRLHLVNWSMMPELDKHGQSSEMKLVQADPFLACQPLSENAKNSAMNVMHVTYRGGCTFMDKADHVRRANGKAVLVLNNVKGEGRFPPGVPATGNVPLPVTMISKVDGEIVMAVMERETPVVRMFVEDPSQLSVLDADPTPLTNEELTAARNLKKAGRNMTFWFVNTSAAAESPKVSTFEFQVLPALFGGKIPSMPYRVVMAYPQDTACHHQGLGILAARAVVLVKRGKCSFGAKMRAVQEVGGAGMLLWNSDESLIPLMTEKKEIAGLRIWGATISLSNGTKIHEILERNKNLPSLVNIAASAEDGTAAA